MADFALKLSEQFICSVYIIDRKCRKIYTHIAKLSTHLFIVLLLTLFMQLDTTLTGLYQQFLDSKTTQTVRKNEKLLSAMHSHPKFLEDNLDVIGSHSVQYDIRRLAAVEMRRYAKTLIQEKNLHSMKVMIDALIQQMCLQELQFGLKSLLMKALADLFSSHQSKGLKLQLIQTVNKAINLASQKMQNINFAYYGYCVQLLVSFKQHANKVNDFIKMHFDHFVGLTHILHLKIIQNEAKQQVLISLYNLAAIYGRVIRTMLSRIRFMQQTTNQLLFSPTLAQVVTMAFKLNHPDNSIETSLLMIHRNQGLALAFNEYKIVYFDFIQLFLRTANGFIRNQNQLQANSLVIFSFSLIQDIISTLCNLFDSQTLFTWSVKSKLVEAAYQLMKILNCALRINSIYYKIFNLHKATINQKIILRCLLLSDQEMYLFEQNPQQFAQRALQVTNRKVQVSHKQGNEEQQQKDNFDMLKCVAAHCLVNICIMQDGAVSHLFDYALKCVSGKNDSKYPLYILYQAMAILRNSLKIRPDIKIKVLDFIERQCSNRISLEDATIQTRINFCYFLILTTTIVQSIEISQNLSRILLNLCEETLTSGCCSWQYVAHQLLHDLSQKGLDNTTSCQVMHLYHSILQRKRPTQKFLYTYCSLLKKNNLVLIKRKDIIVIGIRLIGDYIIHDIQNPPFSNHLITLSLNIITAYGQNYLKIPEVPDLLEGILLPVAKYLETKSHIDFQDDVFSLVTQLIKYRKCVTPVMFKIVNIIPKIYYNQYFQVFSSTFQTLQVFIYYGSEIIEKSPQIIKAIVQLGINSLQHSDSKEYTQTDACAGALLLQTTLIAFWQKLPPTILYSSFDKVMKKLQLKCVNNFLTANLLGLLAILLAQLINHLSYQEGNSALQKILKHDGCFEKVEYSQKVLIVGLSQLLLQVDNQLVAQHFDAIFSVIITILCQQLRKPFDDDDWEQQYAEYDKLLQQVTNKFKELNEFQFFKQNLETLRSKNRPLIQKTLKQLTSYEREGLAQLLRIQKVRNSSRVIYKTK